MSWKASLELSECLGGIQNFVTSIHDIQRHSKAFYNARYAEFRVKVVRRRAESNQTGRTRLNDRISMEKHVIYQEGVPASTDSTVAADMPR